MAIYGTTEDAWEEAQARIESVIQKIHEPKTIGNESVPIIIYLHNEPAHIRLYSYIDETPYDIIIHSGKGVDEYLLSLQWSYVLRDDENLEFYRLDIGNNAKHLNDRLFERDIIGAHAHFGYVPNQCVLTLQESLDCGYLDFIVDISLQGHRHCGESEFKQSIRSLLKECGVFEDEADTVEIYTENEYDAF